MKMEKFKIATVITLLLSWLGASGQYTREISFNSDGFSGRVKVEIKEGYYMEPYFNGVSKEVVISGYKDGKYNDILKKAGIDFPYVLAKGGGFEFSGKALIVEQRVLGMGDEFFESVPISFSTSGTLGSGQVFPPFSDNAKKWLVKKGTDKSIVGKALSGGEAAWHKYGSITDVKITRVYLTDLKNKVENVIRAHESDEKDRKRRFDALISKAKTAATGFNFEAAGNSVDEAKKIAGDREENQVVEKTVAFIEDKKREKEKEDQDKHKKAFESLIEQVRSYAGTYNFEAAKSSLAEAKKMIKDASYGSSFRDAERFIADKQREKEEKDKKETEGKALNELLSEAQKAIWSGDLEKAKPFLEKAYKMDPTNKTMIDLSRQYAKLKEEKDEKEQEYKMAKSKAEKEKKTSGKETVYYPKTNKQLYEDLKAMTDANPGMLNDPKIRSQLRGYKALADRDDRNTQDFKMYQVMSGGRYNATAMNYLGSSMVTNQKIATAEMAVGGAVDAATSLVNGIIAEREREQKQRDAEYKRAEANAKAKTAAISKWEEDLQKNRSDYETKAEGAIKKMGYSIVTVASGSAIKYESQKYVRGGGYYRGNRYYYNNPSFEKVTKVLAHRQVYVVKQNNKYGISGDAGESIYPPQFDDIVTFRSGSYYARFLVKIKDKWGEIFMDGKVLNEIKYDGIWYLPSAKKLLRLGSSWFEQSFKEKNGEEMAEITPTALIPVLGISQYSKSVEEKSFPESILSTATGKIQNAGIEKTYTILDDYNKEKVLIHKLNNHWYKQSFSFNSGQSILVEMPAVFLEKIRSEGEYDKTKRKTIYKWGAINQEGKIVLPVKYDRLVINPKRRTVITEDGQYDSGGKLLRKIDLSDYQSVSQFEPLGIMWYAKPENRNREIEAGIFDEEFNIIYKNAFRAYNFKEEELFSYYAYHLAEKNPDLTTRIYEVLAKKNTAYYNSLGNIFFKEATRDLTKAFKYYSLYLAASKDLKTADINTIRNVARMYQEGAGTVMDKQKALHYFSIGMSHKKYYDVPLIISYIECLLETGNIQKAKLLYTGQAKLKRLNKKEAYYYYLGGYIAEKEGKPKSARSKYKAGIKKSPIYETDIYRSKMEERLKGL